MADPKNKCRFWILMSLYFLGPHVIFVPTSLRNIQYHPIFYDIFMTGPIDAIT